MSRDGMIALGHSEERIMKNNILMAGAVVAALAIPFAENAEDGATTGAVSGAVGGAIVGGPVGAAVGGVGGAHRTSNNRTANRAAYGTGSCPILSICCERNR